MFILRVLKDIVDKTTKLDVEDWRGSGYNWIKCQSQNLIAGAGQNSDQTNP